MLTPNQYGSMLEINVTDDCQLRCKQCNRLCDVAARANYILISAIEKMCSEIPRMKRICIAGGEPMMHPAIEEIINIIKTADIADEILLLTNGVSLASYSDSLGEKYGITVWNSSKKSKPPKHTLLTTVAPVDLNLYGIKDPKQCDILKRCGLGYSSDGYYPCCISAAIGRIFGIHGAGSFSKLTEEKYNELIDQTCRYCGYYLTSEENTVLPKFDYPEGIMTVSWFEALNKYNGGYNAK